MRISDWSSDVCSFDLAADRIDAGQAKLVRGPGHQRIRCFAAERRCVEADPHHAGVRVGQPRAGGIMGDAIGQVRLRVEVERSEEHTSELQSLMRISYAVFCLKKKT